MIYQQSLFGSEQELPDQPSFPEVSPASPSVWLESKKVKGTTVTCGRKCSELSENLRRVGLSVRTYLASCELPLTTFVRTWSVLATKSGYLILKLRLSERCTGEKESRLLPTPCATLGTNGGPNQRDSSGRPGLQMAAMLWATPNTMDYLPQRSPESLARQATTTRKGRARPANLREQVDPEVVRMWPTPTASDSAPNGSAAGWIRYEQDGKTSNFRLRNKVKVGEEQPGQLNPTWVEWLMGFPLGWTDLNASETP